MEACSIGLEGVEMKDTGGKGVSGRSGLVEVQQGERGRRASTLLRGCMRKVARLEGGKREEEKNATRPYRDTKTSTLKSPGKETTEGKKQLDRGGQIDK